MSKMFEKIYLKMVFNIVEVTTILQDSQFRFGINHLTIHNFII